MYKYNTDKSPCSNCIVRACCMRMCQEFLDHIPSVSDHIPVVDVVVTKRDVLPAFLRNIYDENLRNNICKGFTMNIYDINTIAYQNQVWDNGGDYND